MPRRTDGGIVLGKLGGLPSKGGKDAAPRRIPLGDYDRDLAARLAGLGRPQQAVFAAACAERLFPAYAAYRHASGTTDHGLVRKALDLAWEGAAAGALPIGDPAALIEECVSLIPDDEADFTIPPYADDAIAAAAYALEAAAMRSDSAAAMRSDSAAAWAVQRGTDTLDEFLRSTVIDDGDPNADELVWAHPLVQDEVRRREVDYRTLTSGEWASVVAEVRSRASADSVLPVDQLDSDRDVATT